MSRPGGHIGEAERKERFLALLLPLRTRLGHFTRALMHDREEANDLAGDTILAALERFDPRHEPETFRAYLFTIAYRLYRRRRLRASLFRAFDDSVTEHLPGAGPAPDVAYDLYALHRALRRLPTQQREAVVLFEISGLTLEEIRGVQGGSLSGVKSRLVRGRARLAELLGVGEGATVAGTTVAGATVAGATVERRHPNPIDHRIALPIVSEVVRHD